MGACDFTEIELDAIKSGAKDFIVKPFNADRIVQTVNSIFGK